MNKFMKVGTLRPVNGTVVSPQGGGLKLVLLTVTTKGGLDCPMVDILTKKWAKVKENLFKINSYRTPEYGLGYITDLAVQSDVWVMNLMCRDDAGTLHLSGLKKCLANVAKLANYEKASVHLSEHLVAKYPEFVNLIKSELLDNGIDVVYYGDVSLLKEGVKDSAEVKVVKKAAPPKETSRNIKNIKRKQVEQNQENEE